jgi:hypothetical protein
MAWYFVNQIDTVTVTLSLPYREDRYRSKVFTKRLINCVLCFVIVFMNDFVL